MANLKLVTHIFKNHNVEQIIESITEPASTVYYMYVSNHNEYIANTVPSPTNSQQDLIANTYSNMIFGKKITPADVKIMARRVDWVSNTAYAMYDHADDELFDKDFYVVVDEGSFYHIYKCLYNNNGQPSTIQPLFAHASQESDLFDENDGYYRTSDGYQWKYIFSIDEATFSKFSTINYIPIVANTNVEDSAIDGSIDVIRVDSGGSRYDNHFRSAFDAGSLRVTSNAAVLGAYSSDVLYSLGDNINIANAAGSVATASGQANVSGTSTTFALDFQINDYIKVANSTAYEIKRIVSITNNTVMTISGNFSNTFASANVSMAYPFTANPANDYYNECILLVTSGTGIGQYKKIIDYVNDGFKQIVVIESGFDINPDTTSHYEVNPALSIVGNGTETVNCVARAMVNTAAANSIFEIQILERGEFYRSATANVLVSSALSVSNAASLTPIISPFRGHGSDAANELGAISIGFSAKFSNSEANSISTENDYRTIGILKDPLYANVEFSLERLSDENPGVDGTFVEGELVQQFVSLKLAGTVSVNTTSANIEGTSTDFGGMTNSDIIIVNVGTNWFITNIASITNTTQIVATTNASFTNTVANIYKATITANAYVSDFQSPALFVTNAESKFIQGGHIIGRSSFAVANVTNISSNDIDKNNGFLTYSQLNVLIGTLNGTFEEDEVIWQGTSLSTATFVAKYHSINGDNTELFYTNPTGVITNGIVHGDSSSATFTVTDKYKGDLVSGSGIPIYIQNGSNVSRAENQTENIKIIVEF